MHARPPLVSEKTRARAFATRVRDARSTRLAILRVRVVGGGGGQVAYFLHLLASSLIVPPSTRRHVRDRARECINILAEASQHFRVAFDSVQLPISRKEHPTHGMCYPQKSAV